MFELVEKKKPKVRNGQFTITMRSEDIDCLKQIADHENMKFHAFVKAVLLGYVNYSGEVNFDQLSK